MSEFDPFQQKVGDVYDSSGRRIAYVSKREPGCLGWAIIILVVIGALIYGMVAGCVSVKNLVAYGQFTTETHEAQVRAEFEDHKNDRAWFAKRAKDLRITKVTATRGAPYEFSPYVTLEVHNVGSEMHTFTLTGSLTFTYAGVRKTVDITSNPGTKLPAHTRMPDFALGTRPQRWGEYPDRWGEEGYYNQTLLSDLKPSVWLTSLDGLPVVSGPPDCGRKVSSCRRFPY